MAVNAPSSVVDQLFRQRACNASSTSSYIAKNTLLVFCLSIVLGTLFSLLFTSDKTVTLSDFQKIAFWSIIIAGIAALASGLFRVVSCRKK